MKTVNSVAMAAMLLTIGSPVFAQEAPEVRTTYSVNFLRFNRGSDERWDEIMQKYVVPARAAAGLPAQQIHWVAAGEWDIMLIAEMPGGLATMDSHGGPRNEAFVAEMRKLAGSEAAFDALQAEMNTLIADSTNTFTHTHP